MTFSNFIKFRADLQFLKTFLNNLTQLAPRGKVEKDSEPQMLDSGSDMVDLGSDTVDLGSDMVDLGSDMVDLGLDMVDLGLDMVDLGSDTVDESRMVVAQCYVVLVPRMAAPTFRSH